MKNIFFFFELYIFFSNIISESNDEINKLLKWAESNNIYINENLILNKNRHYSHNFFYFTSNSSIPNGTTLLKIPYNIMLTQYSLNKHFHDIKNKKWSKKWDEIVENNSSYISDFLTKQIFYISIVIENAINRKKGSLYKKYEPYFDMYEYINMDNYPVFYEQEEIQFLAYSNFGTELNKLIESLKEEYSIASNDLKISNSILDNFIKYRTLSLGNSISYNNTDLIKEKNYDYNETLIVPFIDCFKKVVSNKESMSKYLMKKDENNELYLEIISRKKIKKGKEITLKWLDLSNQDSLLFYGFIEEKNKYAPAFYVNVFNKVFRRDLGVDKNNIYDKIATRDLYELNSESFEKDVIDSYGNISKQLKQYKNKKDGKYLMMIDNLHYYQRIYDEKYTEDNITYYILGAEKKNWIRDIIKTEKKIIQTVVDDINEIIKGIKENKYKGDL